MERLGTATWPVQPRGSGRALRETAEIQLPYRRRNLPPALLNHLLDRIKTREISSDQLGALADWLDTEPDVPNGKWFKRFSGMTVCGEGELVKTFHSRTSSNWNRNPLILAESRSKVVYRKPLTIDERACASQLDRLKRSRLLNAIGLSDLEATFAAPDFYAKPRAEIFEWERRGRATCPVQPRRGFHT
jgi:hypothetical protein